MNKLLTVIKELNEEHVKKEIFDSNGFLKPGDIKSRRLSLREIAERLNVAIDQLYEPLDELLYDGYIEDHSATSLSWGRKRGCDGQVTKSIGDFVELLF